MLGIQRQKQNYFYPQGVFILQQSCIMEIGPGTSLGDYSVLPTQGAFINRLLLQGLEMPGQNQNNSGPQKAYIPQGVYRNKKESKGQHLLCNLREQVLAGC